MNRSISPFCLRSRFAPALALAAAVASLSIAGCANDAPKPTPLEQFTPQIAGRQVWKMKLSGFPSAQAITVVGTHLVIGASDGTVVEVDGDTGRELWRAQVGARLATGVGSDGRVNAVVTRDGDLRVWEQATPRWQRHLDTTVLTTPFVAGERVFVLGIDRSVRAYDAQDGSLLWVFQRAGDPLTLSQAGVLAAYGDTLLVGQGSRLVALDSLKGTVKWEVPVAAPRGTNEVERLADLVGPAARVGSVFCMRAFQNGLGCVDVDRATALWSLNGSGAQAIAADEDFVFSADSADRVTARRRANGESAWSLDKFQNRRLSGPLAFGKAVVFGDLEGHVHFLARADGQQLLRLPTDGSAVIGTPVRAGATLAVATRDGGVFAFRLE